MTDINTLSKSQLNELTREQLLEIVLSLKEQQPAEEKERKKKKKQGKKDFDITKYPKRLVALRIAYIGFNYQGFASQLNCDNTVEAKILKALVQVKLIADTNPSPYSRCGRTDSGVSALGQVIALELRTSTDDQKPLDYVKMVNGVLPDDIRVLSWSFVDDHFDARFDCLYRTYKYFFVREQLNIDAMRQAGQNFVGSHDFRNFCKINPAQVVSFLRKMLDVKIVRSDGQPDGDDPMAVFEIVICGYSFLWHQIRCMVAVLFLVGKELESPDVVKDLLDVENNPRKPQSTMASEFPLLLHDCVFENVKWISPKSSVEAIHELETHFYNAWKLYLIKAQLVKNMLLNAKETLIDTKASLVTITALKQENPNVIIQRGPKYIKLMDRKTGKSVEEKKAKLNK
jgi:tRNA pseudouridine38/39 synthase